MSKGGEWRNRMFFRWWLAWGYLYRRWRGSVDTGERGLSMENRALYMACMRAAYTYGSADPMRLVREMIERGADPCICNNLPLVAAAACGDVETMDRLYELAGLTKKGTANALGYAAKRGQTKAMRRVAEYSKVCCGRLASDVEA